MPRIFRSIKSASGRLKVVNPDAKFCTIYIFRHAQTYYNRRGIFTGWKDSRLTPLGIRQARKVAKKLKRKQIDVAFQTRLSRSKDTLREVLRFHPECRLVILDNRMIERDYGKLSGTSKKGYEKKHGKSAFDAIHRGYLTGPPGGESLADVEKRVDPFIKELLRFIKKHKVNVAVSAHGNSMRPFRKHFEKLSIKKMCSIENPWDNYFRYRVRV